MVFWQSDLILRFLTAVVFSGLIGLEREMHGRAAGIRTHMLVGVGAAMLTMLPEMTALTFGEESRQWMDSGRLVAGIVTGIGFLGAGAIIKIGDMVRGLTTAAGIWFTAALGAVIGAGYWRMAGWATLISLVILVLVERVEGHLSSSIERELTVTVQNIHRRELMAEVNLLFRENRIVLLDVYYDWDVTTASVEMTFQLKTSNTISSVTLIERLAQVPGVLRILWNH